MPEHVVHSRKSSSESHIPSAHSFNSGRNSSVASFPALSQSFATAIPAVTTNENVVQKKDGDASAPAQLDGGWLSYLLQAAADNPLLVGGTLLAGGLLYWLSQRGSGKKSKPPTQELTEMATKLGFDPQKISNHLNQEAGGLSKEEAAKFLYVFFAHKETKYETDELPKHGLIPSNLIDGLDGSDQQKFNTLFERFNSYSFNYVGISVSAVEGFINRRGDCRTLVNMLKKAADAAGIGGVQVVDSETPVMLVEEHAIHGRGTRGNVEGLTSWYFDEHHWCTLGGQYYDALFMVKAPPPTHFYVETKIHRGVSYLVFNNGWCMIRSSEASDKLNVNLTADKMGIVKSGKQEMKEYINSVLG